ADRDKGVDLSYFNGPYVFMRCVTQDQVGGAAQVLRDEVLPPSVRVVLGPGPARSHEDAPATACVVPRAYVADRVSHHPGGAEVQVQVDRRAAQQARARLAVLVLGGRRAVARGGRRAGVDLVYRGPLLGELAAHLVVDAAELALVDDATADHGLV